MIEHRFKTREQASIKTATQISAAIARRTADGNRAAVIVSGGKTPARCFTELASLQLDWPLVDVFLSDERWVPADHPDSNEKMVREHLSVGPARDIELYGLYRRGVPVEWRCAEIEADIRRQPLPFACALLGMGSDGHFASLFPGHEGLNAAMDPDGDALCIPVQTGASAYARVSLTLSALCFSDEILLLIFGEDKWQVLEQARRQDDRYPVSRLLSQKRSPVNVFWAP